LRPTVIAVVRSVLAQSVDDVAATGAAPGNLARSYIRIYFYEFRFSSLPLTPAASFAHRSSDVAAVTRMSMQLLRFRRDLLHR